MERQISSFSVQSTRAYLLSYLLTRWRNQPERSLLGLKAMNFNTQTCNLALNYKLVTPEYAWSKR